MYSLNTFFLFVIIVLFEGEFKLEHYFTNNTNLKSEFRTIIYKYGEHTLTFTSDLGVFSKDKIDFGSRLLVETFLRANKAGISILDVGCGYGFIGLTLAKLSNTVSTLVDVNKRALHLAEMNAKNMGVKSTIYESDIYTNVTGKFDCVLTNPPIRTGKETVMKFLIGAKDYLKENGELWFVMRKDQGAKSAIAKLTEIYAKVEVVEKSKGFYIIVCKSC